MTAEEYLRQHIGSITSDLLFKLAVAQAEIERLQGELEKLKPVASA